MEEFKKWWGSSKKSSGVAESAWQAALEWVLHHRWIDDPYMLMKAIGSELKDSGS